MRARLARFGFAGVIAATLALTSATAPVAAAAQTPQTWVTTFASAPLPAGTWAEGTWDSLLTFHWTWTLPAPAGETYQTQMNGPYSVDPSAAMYPGNALIRLGGIAAATSLGTGSKNPPACTGVGSFNPGQVTRIVIALASEPVTRTVWNQEMATTTMTAILSDAGGGITVPLLQVKTLLLGGNLWCSPTYLG